MWKKNSSSSLISPTDSNLLTKFKYRIGGVNDHVGASCSWDCCVAIKACTLQLPFSFLLSSKADPAVDTPGLLKGYFVNTLEPHQRQVSITSVVSHVHQLLWLGENLSF